MEGQELTARPMDNFSRRSSVALHSAIMAQIAEGIVVFDAATKHIAEVNPALCSLLGYTIGELVGLTLYEIDAHDRASVDANVAKMVTVGRNTIGERRFRRKDGTLITVEMSAVALATTDSASVCAIIRDTTERHCVDQAIRENEARLQLVLANFPLILYSFHARSR